MCVWMNQSLLEDHAHWGDERLMMASWGKGGGGHLAKPVCFPKLIVEVSQLFHSQCGLSSFSSNENENKNACVSSLMIHSG